MKGRSTPRRAQQGKVAPPAAPRVSTGRGERVAYAVLAGLLALLPLVFDPRLTGSFRAPKAYFAEILGLASLLALAVAGRLRLPALLRSEAARAFLPLAVLAALLAPWTRHPEHLRPSLLGLSIGTACLVGWSVGFSAERLRAVLRWILPAAGATGLLGLTQALGWYQPFGVETEGVRGAERLSVIGLAGNPGDLGASLVVPALVAQAELAHRRSPLALFALVGCVAGIAATQTLSALAALFVGSLFVWGTGASARRWARVAAATVAALTVATLAIAPARERVAEKARDLASGDWNATLTGRLDGWRVAVEIFREHPWTGVGLGTFRAEFSDAKARLLARGVEFFREQQHPVFANVHSEPLEVLAELGVLGLAALAWGLWRLLRRLARLPSAAIRSETGLARGGVAAIALMAAVGFPFRVALVAFPALVVVAWVFATGDGEEEATGASGPGERVWKVALTVALSVALFLCFQGARQRLEARQLLRSVELRTEQLVAAGRFEPRQISAHLAALEDAARRDPSDVSIRIARGNQYLLLGSLPAALEAYREAQGFERRPETHLNLGQTYARSGCDAEAENEWSWAVRLDPTLRRQLPRGWPDWDLEGRVFASGFECGLDAWSEVCPGPDARCGKGR